MEPDKQLNDKQKEMIRNFKWNDDDNESTDPQPGSEFATEVNECVELISQYVLENMSPSHFNEQSWVLSVPIPISVHRLLQERYNSDYSEDSRLEVFDIVRAVCEMIVGSEFYSERLEKQINEKVFPSKADDQTLKELKAIAAERNMTLEHEVGVASSQYKVKWCRLYDDPEMSVITTEKSVEGTVSNERIEGGEVILEIQLENAPCNTI